LLQKAMTMKTRRATLLAPFALGAAVLALGACDGSGAKEATSGCKATRTVVPADQVTALGFSGQELLANAVGDSAGTLTWRTVDANELDTNLPPGPTMLSLQVTPNGDVRFVDQENVGAGAIGCPDAMEADVRVLISSEDGLLAEDRNGILTAMTSTETHLSLSFVETPPAGTLRAEPAPASGLTLVFFTLAARFAANGLTDGTISVGLEGSTADARFLKNAILGSWTNAGAAQGR
jgi:hypothetical protein